MSQSADGVPCRLTAWVHGRVQNVGFRWWTSDRAAALGLVGTATNLDDGTVEVIAEGPHGACLELLESLRGRETPGRVTHVVERWGSAAGGLTGFRSR